MPVFNIYTFKNVISHVNVKWKIKRSDFEHTKIYIYQASYGVYLASILEKNDRVITRFDCNYIHFNLPASGSGIGGVPVWLT